MQYEMYKAEGADPFRHKDTVYKGTTLKPVCFSLLGFLYSSLHLHHIPLIMIVSGVIWACFYFLAVLAPGGWANSEKSPTQDSAALLDRARRILSENPLIGWQNYPAT